MNVAFQSSVLAPAQNSPLPSSSLAQASSSVATRSDAPSDAPSLAAPSQATPGQRRVQVRHRDAMRVAAELLAAQHGAATRYQLRACGLGDRQIERRVHEGRLKIVARGVYVITTSAPTWERRVFAAQLFTSRRASPAALSHRTAGAVYGFHGATKETTTIELIAVPTDRHTNPLATMYRCSHLLPEDIEMCSLGLPITSPNRTLLDLCLERTRIDEIEFMISDAHVRGLIDLESFAARVELSRRQAGIVMVRRALLRVMRDERKRTRRTERIQASSDRRLSRAISRAAAKGAVFAA